MEKGSSLCDQIFESMMLMSAVINNFMPHEVGTGAQRPSGKAVPWPHGLTSFTLGLSSRLPTAMVVM